MQRLQQQQQQAQQQQQDGRESGQHSNPSSPVAAVAGLPPYDGALPQRCPGTGARLTFSRSRTPGRERWDEAGGGGPPSPVRVRVSVEEQEIAAVKRRLAELQVRASMRL